jgi:hypothetical protein
MGLIRIDQDWNIMAFGDGRVIVNAEKLHARLEEIALDCNTSSVDE